MAPDMTSWFQHPPACVTISTAMGNLSRGSVSWRRSPPKRYRQLLTACLHPSLLRSIALLYIRVRSQKKALTDSLYVEIVWSRLWQRVD
jgi:hypothetical protein